MSAHACLSQATIGTFTVLESQASPAARYAGEDLPLLCTVAQEGQVPRNATLFAGHPGLPSLRGTRTPCPGVAPPGRRGDDRGEEGQVRRGGQGEVEARTCHSLGISHNVHRARPRGPTPNSDRPRNKQQ